MNSTFEEALLQKGIKKILVLGHTGFVGSKFIQAIKNDLSMIPSIGLSQKDIDLCDVNSASRLAEFFDEETALIVFSGIKKQLGDTLESFSSNMRIGENITKALSMNPVKRCIFFSSSDVYGHDIHNTAISEKTRVQPRTYYAIAKYALESLFMKAFENDESGTLAILRPPLIYGTDEVESIYGPSGFTKSAMMGHSILMWGDGSELREFLFVDDVVEITKGLLPLDFQGVLNPVSGESSSFEQILSILRERLNSSFEVSSCERSRDKIDHGFDNTVFLNHFPNFQHTGLDKGIRTIIEQYNRKLNGTE